MALHELELMLKEAARSGEPLSFVRGRQRVTIYVEDLQSWEIEAAEEPDPQDHRIHPAAIGPRQANRVRLSGR